MVFQSKVTKKVPIHRWSARSDLWSASHVSPEISGPTLEGMANELQVVTHLGIPGIHGAKV